MVSSFQQAVQHGMRWADQGSYSIFSVEYRNPYRRIFHIVDGTCSFPDASSFYEMAISAFLDHLSSKAI